MNLEQARKVLWLPNKCRPLGELLDEGYLTRPRLEWAARKAYDPALKEAAQVILNTLSQYATPNKPIPPEQTKEPFPVGMPLEKAQLTKWPLPPHKGKAMGELVESKQIFLKDLGYMVENAWDRNVKLASITLLLKKLGQILKEPEPPAGFVRVVSGGRSYSKRAQTRLTLLEGMVYGIVLATILGLCILWVTRSLQTHPNAKPASELFSSASGVIAIVVVLGLIILVSWLIFFILPDKITKRLDKEIEKHQLGEEGEEKAVQMIVQALDGNWGLFRNIALPGRNKGDLDIVLVGPPGVWVLEVKNLNGEYRNTGEAWEYRRGGIWKISSVNPSRQATNNSLRLKNFLQADNLKVFVNPAVVWVNEEKPLLVENPSTAIWTFSHLPDELGNIWQGEKLTAEERSRIAEKLNKLCEAGKK
jgi:hypothetical protein